MSQSSCSCHVFLGYLSAVGGAVDGTVLYERYYRDIRYRLMNGFTGTWIFLRTVDSMVWDGLEARRDSVGFRHDGRSNSLAPFSLSLMLFPLRIISLSLFL